MSKQLPADYFTLTEIGGVGEMVYRAVRFPEYVPEYDEARKKMTIVPLFTAGFFPEAGTDFSITGQALLADLINLYTAVNDPEGTNAVSDLVWMWCRKHPHPYDIDYLCSLVQTGSIMDLTLHDELRRVGPFDVDDFVRDLCKLGVVFEYYDALQKVMFEHNAAAGRSLYYEGRFRDSLPFLERYRPIQEDADYLRSVSEDYDELIFHLIDLFPDFRLRLKQDQKTHKIELVADIDSVFDIAWYTFARLVATVAPPVDTDLRYEYSQGSILTCMACGEYFVRHSSRQRYCDSPDCQAERNKRKSRAYYQRKKAAE